MTPETALFNELDLRLLVPALLAGFLVSATHVPLGRVVLKRGIIFLDLAIAQVAALGLVIAYSFHWQPASWQVQVIAMLAALGGVLFLYYCDKTRPEIQEAIIGSVFVLASSAMIILLSTNPQGGEQLKELLVGQILWVSYDQLIQTAGIYILVYFLWLVFRNRSSSLLFYILFALSITASVQLVGVYLVFATLILPALAIRNLKQNTLLTGYVIATSGYILGLIISSLLDLPTGAVTAFSLALVSFITATAMDRLKSSVQS